MGNSAGVYVSPAAVDVSRVQTAVDKLRLPEGVLAVEAEQITVHPEDWGDYSIVVYLFGVDAPAQAAPYARALAEQLGVEVLTEVELDRRLAAATT